MPARYIYIQNQRYYLYADYGTWEQALRVAKHFRKKVGCRYFILKASSGGLFEQTRYILYLNKVISLW